MFTTYEITRTEATKVVETYMKCTNDPLSQKGRKCKYTAPMKTFRDMTSDKHMGAVLVGKGPSKEHTKNSDMFFIAIKELVDSLGKEEVYETQQRIMNTTMREYCNLSCSEPAHCEFIKCPAERTLRYLSGAINNYFQQTHKHIKEALGDNANEYNDCSVCKWAGTDYFYYSTIYGLNVPVCSMCVEEKEKEKFNKDSEIDEYEGYVFVYKEDETEPQVCSVCNYNGCGSFYYSSDKMDEPVCHTCEMKYRETADCSQRIYHNVSEYGYDGEGVLSEEEEDDNDSEYVPSEEEDDDDDDSDDPHCQENDDKDDPEKFFGCEGCQYEWRDGWKKGWKAAMKQINKFTKQQKRPENIHIPECAYCGASHNLKKCAGTCEGAVRYCSLVCQKKDWKEGHKQECSK